MTECGSLVRFAHWVTGAEPLDASGRKEAQLSLLDTLSCMASGARTGTAAKALASARAAGGRGPCTAFGAGELTPAHAAYYYGVAGHCEELDDSELIGSTHPSTVLFAALLTLAEVRKATVNHVLDAYAAGLATIVHVGRALGFGHYQKGWHATSTLGPMGAGCACARLLRLDARGTAAAIAIGSSRAAGMRLQFETDTKSAHVGFAAQAGLEAALHAEAGLTASDLVWDAPGGLLDLYGDGTGPGFSAPPTGALEVPRGMLARKAYPCCHYAHRAIEAARSLEVSWPDIVSGVVSLPEPYARVVDKTAPTSPSEARFSVLYCVACALIDAQVDGTSFTERALARPEVRGLTAKLCLEQRPVPADIEDLSPAHPDRVTLRLCDGRTVQAEQAHTPGGPSLPLEQEDVVEKALRCFVAGGISEASARQVSDAILALPEDLSIRALLAAMHDRP
jgi:2-methylcitrate dehydratase PrpD